MTTRTCLCAAAITVTLAAAAWGQPIAPATSQPGEVTLRGNVLCNRATSTQPWNFDPRQGDHTPVIFAIDGPAAIAAEVGRIVRECCPRAGLDVDAAGKLLDRFSERLKFHIDGPLASKLHFEWGSTALALTGRLRETDGIKWITVSKFEPTKLSYPAAMMAADKPFQPAGEPLTLKIDDRLTLSCVRLPAGRFLQGTPFYQFPRWQDEFPHMVSITRPFYMAECPVTQEVFEAVMGKNPSVAKGAMLPVQNAPFADIQKFCRVLSQRTGKVVRLPTDAEWEYAARAGTSNPCFREKYAAQDSTDAAGKAPLPVKSKQPNAWGLYDMVSVWWEVVSDRKADNARSAMVDPGLPAPAGRYDARPMERKDKGGGLDVARGGQAYSLGTHGAVDAAGKGGEGSTKFRIVVEVNDTAASRPD